MYLLRASQYFLGARQRRIRRSSEEQERYERCKRGRTRVPKRNNRGT